jgi:transcriptional regulator with PAS, ATPase and Fis domain
MVMILEETEMRVDDKILIFASYEEMGRICKRRLGALNLDVEVVVVEIEKFGVSEKEYLDYLKEVISHDKELIISRGTLANIIKRNFDIQVVEMEVSFADVLRSMWDYLDYQEPIAVIECDTFTNKVKQVGDMFGLDIRVYNIEKIEDYNIGFKAAIDDGIKIIFSGGWLKYYDEGLEKIMENKDAVGVMIETSEEAIIAALDDALNRYMIIYQEKQKNEMLNTVLDFSIGGVIAIDRNGQIIVLNNMAEKFFSNDKRWFIGKDIKSVVPDINFDDVLCEKKIVRGDLQKINGKSIIINKVPLIVEDEVVGAVATFQEIEDLQKIEHDVRVKLVDRGLSAKYNFDSIKTNNKAMHRLVDLSKSFARIESTVLITGETGTGKEVFAQSIHNASLRKNKAFVAVNCSALPSNLLESELFGYVEGAFTGAKKGGKVGIFELAHKGTIFLDEIGDIDKSIQSKLLRVLQEKEIMRIGDNRVIPIDVRIITATNKDLYSEVMDENFRSDLYYRLNVLNINLPPLRDRKEDIALLVKDLIKRINDSLRCKVTGVDKKTIEFFQRYSWPGNIRELQNVIEKIVAVTETGKAKYDEVQYFLEDLNRESALETEFNIYDMKLEEIEKHVIEEVLKHEKYNKARTADHLGISKSTLFRKLDKM